MEMKVVAEYPPNFDLIKTVLLGAGPEHTYCYGDTIYAPDGHEVPPDVTFHEREHARQQAGEPQAWWMRYLSDPDFRLEQEEEAYGEQYIFALQAIENAAEKAPEGQSLAAGKNNLKAQALFTIAQAFSNGAYALMLSYSEAETRMRHYAKRHLSERREKMLSQQE